MTKCAGCKTFILWGAKLTDGKPFCSQTCLQNNYLNPVAPVQECTTSGITLDFLHYGEKSSELVPGTKSVFHQTTPISNLVIGFGFLWIVGLFIIDWQFLRVFQYWTFLKLLPLLSLPLFGRTRGLTHLVIDKEHVHFQSRADKTLLKETRLPWRIIDRIEFVPAPAGKAIFESAVVFHSLKGKHRIKLRKIGTAYQWKLLLMALDEYCRVPHDELDPRLFDKYLSIKDPSYTSLWLEAMACPPQRQRLEPLAPAAVLQGGQYLVESQLGSGGQGRAYLANSSKHGMVVLKEYILPVYVESKVRKQAVKDFEHEVSLLKQLDNDRVVKAIDAFLEDHRAYLVMERIDGVSLKQLVKQQGPLPNAQVLGYAAQMCEILQYLHSRTPALIHRDFTPDNLLVCNDGTLKLIDFSAAQLCSETSGSEVEGKYHYMPPEQFRGQVLPASDIYALGCTLHYLLTGEDPVPISTSFPILQQEDVLPSLSDIVAKCTALDTRDRYRSASEVLAALEPLLQTQPAGFSCGEPR